MNLNVLLRGQSNAVILGSLAGPGGIPAVAADIQTLLGFDGVIDTVTLQFQWQDPTGRNTAVGGTALIGDWLTPVSTNGKVSWQTGTLEQGLLDYIGTTLTPAQRASPSVVLWLHNEYDSTNPALTAATWEGALRYDAGLVRAAYGQAIPYIFVDPVPYVSGTDAGAQAIRLGMADLVADPSFGALLTASTHDLNMDAVVFGAGGHMDPTDAATVALRAASTIAESFAAYAKPGSPVAIGLGNLDDTGPVAVQATQTGARQLTVQLQLDGANGLAAPDAVAASGTGWSIIAGGVEVTATGVTVVGPHTLVVNFGADLPPGARLYYGYGNAKLAGADGLAQGNAIYDDHGVPLSVPAAGLVIGAAAVAHGTTQAGTAGADTIVAGSNGDIIISNKGNDYLSGGAGNDIFVFSLGDGQDWIDNFTPGQDSLKFTLGITAADVHAQLLTVAGVAGLGVFYGNAGDAVFLAHVAALSQGSLQFATPPAPPGVFVLGTDGADKLGAGAGGDTLIGGRGNDYLVGNTGHDVFGFARGDGSDWIDNFTPGSDRLVFADGLVQADLSFERTSALGVSGLAIHYNRGADLVFLAGVSALQPNDIQFAALPHSPAIGDDFNGDGNSDLLLRNSDGTVVSWQTDHAGGVTGILLGSLGAEWSQAGTADFNADGTTDLLLRNIAGPVVVWEIAGGAPHGVLLGALGPEWIIAGTGDFNGDASQDILLRNSNGGTVYWQMNHDVVSQGVDLGALGQEWHTTGTADFNGDGSTDLLLRNDAGAIVAWEMTGGAPHGVSLGVLGAEWTIAGTGDFNGDGSKDILLRNADGTVVFWEMNHDVVAKGVLFGSLGPEWAIAGIADVNGDGSADILLHKADGAVVAWEMTGGAPHGVLLGTLGNEWHVG